MPNTPLMSFDFGPLIDASIARFTVGLLSLREGNQSPLGSGTLVTCGGNKGILTCGHVVAALSGRAEFGVVTFPVRQTQRQGIKIPSNVSIDMATKFYSAPDSKGGPDLAFIPIPAVEFSKFTSTASVFDLDLGKKRSAHAPLDCDVIEVLAGVLGQLTPPPLSAGNTVTQPVEGLASTGSIVEVSSEGDWDQLHFKPKQDADLTPSNYQGTSGGGIWRMYVRKSTEDAYECVESTLIGVAYWQEPHAGSLDVFGHGPHSIYSQLLDAICAS